MSITSLLLIPLILCAATIGFFVFRASPRTTFIVWTLSLFFVPTWVGVVAGPVWAVTTLLTVAAIIANLPDLRFTLVDVIVAAFAFIVIALFALKLVTLSAIVIALLEWIVPYVWGRVVLTRISTLFLSRVLASVAVAAATVALIEFMTRYNFFVTIPGPGSLQNWRTLQSRGSLLRAEGAFGHSIALGASLAMSSVFVLAARWRGLLTVLALLIVVGAIVATLSRIGLVAVTIALGLALLMLPNLGKGLRVALGVGGALGALAIVPFIQGVFDEAGDGAADSAAYRGSLLALVPEVQLFGNAGDWSGRTVGGTYLGAYANSVDNAMLLIGLRFGWVPTLLVVAAFVLIAVRLLRGHANPATIAVVSQLPALVTVALITQWGMFLWFLVGLAVAWGVQDDDEVMTAAGLKRRPTLVPHSRRGGEA